LLMIAELFLDFPKRGQLLEVVILLVDIGSHDEVY
jgi:hypothetical protein